MLHFTTAFGHVEKSLKYQNHCLSSKYELCSHSQQVSLDYQNRQLLCFSSTFLIPYREHQASYQSLLYSIILKPARKTKFLYLSYFHITFQRDQFTQRFHARLKMCLDHLFLVQQSLFFLQCMNFQSIGNTFGTLDFQDCNPHSLIY